MTEYIVRWEIDVEAVDAEEAARKAMDIQRTDSIAHVYAVFYGPSYTAKYGEKLVVTIDLDTGEWT